MNEAVKNGEKKVAAPALTAQGRQSKRRVIATKLRFGGATDDSVPKEKVKD